MTAELFPTTHLIEKMKARKVTWGEIVETVEKPEVSFGPDERGRMVHQKGSLAVVVSRSNNVITVLFRQEKQWTDEDMARNRVATIDSRE